MDNRELLAIATPTYNRAYILNKCYDSLKKQTNNSFTWMIIDDGSTDETESIVKSWMQEDLLDIQYLKKSNGGKASALNLAISKTNTKYFVCLDSDDTFSENAVELALKHLTEIEQETRYCGILSLRNTPDGKVMGGEQIPMNVTEITLSDLDSIYNIKSELICFYKTDVIKKFRFPEIPGEKFISPAYLEHEVGRNYKFLASREIYCYCEYLPDGLTKNKIDVIKKNPKGYTLVKKQSFELANRFIPKCKHAIMYIAGSILSGDNFIKDSPNRAITLILYPLGWLVYKKKFRK